jgi:hypothetical protein
MQHLDIGEKQMKHVWLRGTVVSILLTVGCGMDGEESAVSAEELGESTAALSSPWIANYGYNAGGWRVEKHPRTAADVNADGRADIIGFADDGVYVSLSMGSYFSPPRRLVNDFGYVAGGWRVDRHPRMAADVDGDRKADIIGFADNGVYVSRSMGSYFLAPQLWTSLFGYNQGWTRYYPRVVADANGDTLADIIAFSDHGTYVSISTGAGFLNPVFWSPEFGSSGWSVDYHPRTAGDVNGDGMADIVGFGSYGVYVALSNGGSFSEPTLWVGDYGNIAGQWSVSRHPRMTADVNGDRKQDIVGFANDGVYVSLSTGGAFEYPQLWANEFGYYAGNWTVDRHPRVMGDATGDGRWDVIGFSNIGTHVAPSSGFNFSP